MKFDAVKHNLKWNTWIGEVYRKSITNMGLRFLSFGRWLIKKGMGRCSWCGYDCGMNSTVSRKGLRCSSLDRNCTDRT